MIRLGLDKKGNIVGVWGFWFRANHGIRFKVLGFDLRIWIPTWTKYQWGIFENELEIISFFVFLFFEGCKSGVFLVFFIVCSIWTIFDEGRSFARRTFTTPKIRTFATPKFGHLPPLKTYIWQEDNCHPHFFLFSGELFLAFSIVECDKSVTIYLSPHFA